MDEQHQLSLFLVTNISTTATGSGTTAGAAQVTTSNEWQFYCRRTEDA
jgi:hypothetical protein